MQEPFKHRTSKNQPRKPLKAVYFLTKLHNYFWKHGKRINMQKRFFTHVHSPPLAHTHTRAHQAILDFCVHLFTTAIQNTVCKWVKGEGFTPIFPSPMPSPKVLGIYAPCIFHALWSDKRSQCVTRTGTGWKDQKGGERSEQRVKEKEAWSLHP